jgi:3-methylcrotonyl-CoA carboxylase alpha subunit
LNITGHAIEARVYAEDTARDFLPGAGVVSTVRFPDPAQSSLRVDSAIREGDTIGVYYDPMIAKLIVSGYDRFAAIRQMSEALRVTHIGGVKTNLDLLQRVLAHDGFINGDLNTDFIEQHRAALIANAEEHPPSQVLGLTALAELLYRKQQAEQQRHDGADTNSPWHDYSGWRLNAPANHTIALAYGMHEYRIDVVERTGSYEVAVPGSGALTIVGQLGTNGEILAQIDSERVQLSVLRDAQNITISSATRRWDFLTTTEKDYDTEHALPGQLSAPMPGRVVRVCVEQGQTVAEGEPLVVMEAMKMEHTISAPYAGEITSLRYRVGDLVDEGVELLVLDPANPELES